MSKAMFNRAAALAIAMGAALIASTTLASAVPIVWTAWNFGPPPSGNTVGVIPGGNAATIITETVNAVDPEQGGGQVWQPPSSYISPFVSNAPPNTGPIGSSQSPQVIVSQSAPRTQTVTFTGQPVTLAVVAIQNLCNDPLSGCHTPGLFTLSAVVSNGSPAFAPQGTGPGNSGITVSAAGLVSDTGTSCATNGCLGDGSLTVTDLGGVISSITFTIPANETFDFTIGFPPGAVPGKKGKVKGPGP